ncbi:hypothetical protein OZX65_00990 [Leuconostocaceae bacterium ESL0723]|nr:hypothetical protein OZX65_00990 [Leuconostocaceae bacterium ESL0723]
MVNENIWDVLEHQEIDIEQEYRNLWALLKKPMVATNIYGSGYITLFEVIDREFINLKGRYTYVDFNHMLTGIGLGVSIGVSSEIALNELDRFVELVTSFLTEIYEKNRKNSRYHFNNILAAFMQNVDLIVEKTNQKLVEINKNQWIIVPNDELVTTAADTILPDDERLALSILGYTHYANKDDLVEKRNVLRQLGNYTEQERKRRENDDIGFALNRTSIRHGDSGQVSMSEAEMNDYYDLLFREFLIYLTEREHDQFVKKTKELKSRL